MIATVTGNTLKRMREEIEAPLRDEIARLKAELKEASMLIEATARYYPGIPFKPRLDACLLEIRRALELKP